MADVFLWGIHEEDRLGWGAGVWLRYSAYLPHTGTQVLSQVGSVHSFILVLSHLPPHLFSEIR